MANKTPAGLRAFVRRHTSLQQTPDLPGVRLHVGGDAMALLQAAGAALGQPDPPLPFWAYPWSGGLAIARYLVDHPEVVVDRRVLDVASGSGLCAIVALQQGASEALAVDVDPLAGAAIALNGRVNGVHPAFTRRDVLDQPPDGWEVVLAGDICYEEAMATRLLDWLSDAARHGSRVLIGDPGRRYLPAGLHRLASYRVRTSREIEESLVKESSVYSLVPS